MGNIEPNYKTLVELEQYLVKRYNARLEEKIDESRINTIKYSIIHNHYRNLLNYKRVLVDDMEGLTIQKENELLEEMRFIRSIPNETINLDLVNYEFNVYCDSIKIGEFEILIDRTTATVSPQYSLRIINDYYKNEMNNICGDILLYQGVSSGDIEEKNQRYVDYMATKNFYERF